MSNAIHLRQGRPDDANAIADVFLAARSRCMSYLPRVHSDDDVRAWIASVVCNSPELWVAEHKGRLQAFMLTHGDHLEHLYVHPDSHNLGIGSVLLDKVKELRPSGFRLWVFLQNEQARHFYERRGLTLLRQTDGSTNEERTPDAEYMWKP